MQIPTKRDVDISKRSYNPGDEDQIVDLLNRSFGGWGDISMWRWKHTEYPGFENDNIYIVEANGSIIGHRGLVFRNVLLLSEDEIRTASIADTAVDPHYNGQGIYKRMHIDTIEMAKSKSAHIMFSWNGKGSTTYKNNKKTGFIEVKMPNYVKILNIKMLIRERLETEASKNKISSKILTLIGPYIYITTENDTFCIIDPSEEDCDVNKRPRFEILLDIATFNVLANIIINQIIYAPLYLFQFLLSRKLKIKFIRS